MKKVRLVGFISLILVIFIIWGIGPAIAQEPNGTFSDRIISNSSFGPAPINDPSEAVPFSNDKNNTVNPKSPLYSPNAIYGKPGTRFGPPDDRTDTTPLDSSREAGHRHWGTVITTTDGVQYTYGKLNFSWTQVLPNGTTLYAPTLLGTNDSPLEILSRYWWDGATLKREIAVFNHETGLFEVSIGDVADYISGNGYYAEILLYLGIWYAMIYNFDTSQWETWETQIGGSGPDPLGRGWCVWEEYDFDEEDWPNLGQVYWASLLYIAGPGVGSTFVTSSHGNETSDKGSAPYDFDFISNYYYWYIDGNNP